MELRIVTPEQLAEGYDISDDGRVPSGRGCYAVVRKLPDGNFEVIDPAFKLTCASVFRADQAAYISDAEKVARALGWAIKRGKKPKLGIFNSAEWIRDDYKDNKFSTESHALPWPIFACLPATTPGLPPGKHFGNVEAYWALWRALATMGEALGVDPFSPCPSDLLEQCVLVAQAEGCSVCSFQIPLALRKLGEHHAGESQGSRLSRAR